MTDNTARGADTGALNNARETIRAKAADLASNAKEKASEQFDSKLGIARNEINSIASALRRVGDQLRHENGSSIAAGVFSAVAERVDTFGAGFEGRDLDGVLDDVQRIARRNPAAFAGTLAAVGFLAARFLKSSGRSWRSNHEESLAPLDYSPEMSGYREFTGSGYGTAGRPTSYGSGAGPTGYGSGASSGTGSSTLGWDTPSAPGSGLTGTAEGIGNPPAGTIRSSGNSGTNRGGSGSTSGGV